MTRSNCSSRNGTTATEIYCQTVHSTKTRRKRQIRPKNNGNYDSFHICIMLRYYLLSTFTISLSFSLPRLSSSLLSHQSLADSSRHTVTFVTHSLIPRRSIQLRFRLAMQLLFGWDHTAFTTFPISKVDWIST